MKTLKEIDPDGWVLLTDEAKQHVLALEFIRDAYQTELDPVVRDMIATDIDHMKTRCTVCGECTVCNLRPCRDGGPHKPNQDGVN